jgi:hypothetical protein
VIRPDLERYETDDLEALPVLTQGQADDLHVEENGTRYWLSRTGRADGEPFDNTVTVEEFDAAAGAWKAVLIYDGDRTYHEIDPTEGDE